MRFAGSSEVRRKKILGRGQGLFQKSTRRQELPFLALIVRKPARQTQDSVHRRIDEELIGSLHLTCEAYASGSGKIFLKKFQKPLNAGPTARINIVRVQDLIVFGKGVCGLENSAEPFFAVL